MRILTGDDCGLIKEVIPELCRPNKTNNDVGNARNLGHTPATSIQTAASSCGKNSSVFLPGGKAASACAQQKRAVRRLEPAAEAQGRERGLVSMEFLPTNNTHDWADNDDDGSKFHFAALRMNGCVETWSAARPSSSSGYSNTEINVTPATYRKCGVLATSILSQNDEEDPVINGQSAGSKGWYTRQPIRPIGMVSTNHSKPILATCDSIGNVCIMQAHDMNAGIVRRYNAFDIRAAELPTPSSPKNNRCSKGTLTCIKGGFANTHIATSMALCGEGERLAVGGRERGVRVLDLGSGKLLWKVRTGMPQHGVTYSELPHLDRQDVPFVADNNQQTKQRQPNATLATNYFISNSLCTMLLHRRKIFPQILRHCCNSHCGQPPSSTYTLPSHIPTEPTTHPKIFWPPELPTNRFKYTIFALSQPPVDQCCTLQKNYFLIELLPSANFLMATRSPWVILLETVT